MLSEPTAERRPTEQMSLACNYTQLVSTCGNSTACCLVTKPGSLLLPPPLFSKPVAPPPTIPWRKLAQHAHNTKHLVNMKEATN